jgi:hypothetical protein
VATDTISDAAQDWLIEDNDFGGYLVRHRHWDGTAVAFVYSNPGRVWAECSICPADVDLASPGRPGVTTA